ncbi:acetyl-CoA carboxylase biotin carboxyl carrier protein subunit [Anaerocolumna xylanovorans]|uniref:Biotin-requiring enzyme n=1 Tax=Anaerocolumna xylanovorans DSM 12503 TaxID=1121345 RepID=A0A1M7Y2C2_9FIRM|nr:acetyl-CoA carboxylase biotin carboxyl carrier protein subunit [Anaerocolumna xylanovorans]SHO46024.1 Biotin-requiring enzyme [Anaerocolumna xylanovorans DSM 12503]
MVYEVILGKTRYGIEVDDNMVCIVDEREAIVPDSAEDKDGIGDGLPDFVFDDSSNKEQIISPMQGRIIAVHVAEGQRVEKNDIVATLESMKMEINVFAHRNGVVGKILVKEGCTVKNQETLMSIEYDQ